MEDPTAPEPLETVHPPRTAARLSGHYAPEHYPTTQLGLAYCNGSRIVELMFILRTEEADWSYLRIRGFVHY
eukprot:3053053-Rhodomonas_salina.2